jgi:hypothetical protein
MKQAGDMSDRTKTAHEDAPDTDEHGLNDPNMSGMNGQTLDQRATILNTTTALDLFTGCSPR